MSPLARRNGARGDAFAPKRVTPLVTRTKSLTLRYRQRTGKRVTTRHQAEKVTHPLFDVVARACARARKATTSTTRHHASPPGGTR